MKGRRSSDQNFVFGFPKEFSENLFPKDSEIVSHAHFLRRQNCSLGIWKSNTSDQEVSKAVARDICGIWDKTPIPHYGMREIRSVKVVNVQVKHLEKFMLLTISEKVKPGRSRDCFMEAETTGTQVFQSQYILETSRY